MITSLLRQNDVATSSSFWRNNDVIIASCVRWGVMDGEIWVWYDMMRGQIWISMLGVTGHCNVRCLAHRRFERNFIYVIVKLILVIGGLSISCEIALRWMSLDITEDKSTLVQVMAWCRRATSHYLSKCWPRSVSSYVDKKHCLPQNFLFIMNQASFYELAFFLALFFLSYTFVFQELSCTRKTPAWTLGAQYLTLLVPRLQCSGSHRPIQ